MFRGTSTVKLDTKGRFAIPAKYRERLRELCAAKIVVVLSNDDPCLMVYPLPVWQEVEDRLNKLPTSNKKVQRFKRLMLSNAEDCDMDAQGRVLLPARLREALNLQREVSLMGQGNKFELWDNKAWQEIHGEIEEDDGETPDELLDFVY